MLNYICGIFIIIPLFILLMILTKKRVKNPIWYLPILMFSIYLGCVLTITFFPLPISKEVISLMREQNYLSNNFIPFKSILHLLKGDFNIILKNIFGNILLFVPLGFFIPLLFEKFKNFKSVFLIGLLSSLSIESTQFLISLFLGFTYRNTDIDDIILNVIGCVFGFIIYKTLIFISKGKFIMEI